MPTPVPNSIDAPETISKKRKIICKQIKIICKQIKIILLIVSPPRRATIL